MARINIWETVVNGSGLPISGASVDVWEARTTNDVTIFANEVGGGTLANPVTTTNGNIPGWVEEAEIDLHVTGVGITETTKRFNAVLGGNPKKAADSITATEIAPDTITAAEVAPGAIGSAELAADSVIAGKIAAGAISQAADFAAGVVDSAALGANSVIAGKIAAGAVEAGDIAAGGISASTQFAAGVVDAAALAASAVTNAKLGAAAVTNAKITDGTINPQKFNLSSHIGKVAGTGAAIGPLTTALTDVTDLSLNLNMTSHTQNMFILVNASVDCEVASASSGSLADETIEIHFWLTGVGDTGIAARHRLRAQHDTITSVCRTNVAALTGFNLTIGTNYTIKVQVKVTSGDVDTDSVVYPANSHMSWIAVGV